MMTKAFLTVLNMSFTGAMVILAVIVARYLLRKAPKWLLYGLWLVVLFRLLCPVSFESLYSLLPGNPAPAPSEILYMATPTVDTGLKPLDTVINQSLPPAVETASINPIQVLLMVGSMIWALGIAVVAGYGGLSLMRLKKRLLDAKPFSESVSYSKQIDTPFVLGIFRPHIYLPTNLDPQQETYVLMHEEMHIQRLDPFFKALAYLALTLHWFNPLVWLAFILSSKDMEMACDEAVVGRLGSQVKKEYATTLLSLSAGRMLVRGTPLAFGEGNIRNRIQNILDYRKPTPIVLGTLTVLLLFFSVGLLSNPIQQVSLFEAKEISFDAKQLLYVKTGILTVGNQELELSSSQIVESVETLNRLPINKKTLNALGQSIEAFPIKLSFYEKNNTQPALMIYFNKDYSVIRISAGSKGPYSYQVMKPDTIKKWIQTIEKNNTPIQPKRTAADLWAVKTPYVGNNSAVMNVLSALSMPVSYKHTSIELHTQGKERGIHWYMNGNYLPNRDDGQLQQAALMTLALIDNLESFDITIIGVGGTEKTLHYDLAWANGLLSADVKSFSNSKEALEELVQKSAQLCPIVRYQVTHLGPNETVLADRSLDDPTLAESVIFNYAIKSSAAKGNDIRQLKECYRIRQSYPQLNEVHDYYAYLLPDGASVLQSSRDGMYSRITKDLYEGLIATFQ